MHFSCTFEKCLAFQMKTYNIFYRTVMFPNEQLLAVQPTNNKARQKYFLYHEHIQYERVYMV